MNSRILAIAVALVAVQVASAQFPDIGPWSGFTASSQPQGFGMGNPLTLTWSIIPDGTLTASSNNGNATSSASNLIASFDATFGAGPGGSDLTQRPWFNTMRQVYERWGQVSGVTMVYEAHDDGVGQITNNLGILGVRGDMRVGGRNIDGASNILAFNYFPVHGDMVVDTSDMALFGQSANNFRFLRDTLEHELGHGFGMNHVDSSNSSILMEPFINTAIDGPQQHDIMMAHRGYGDANEKSNGGLGNDIASNATNLGALFAGTPISIGNSARNASVSETAVDFVSIDDQSDTDFFKFTLNQESVVDITLEVLGRTYNIGPQNGTQVSFNSALRSDLSLALFDSTGTNQLAFSNLTGLGGNEALQRQLLSGTYLVRITGLDNADALQVDTQMYGLTLNATAVPEPATMTLLTIAAAAIARRKRKQNS